MEGPTGNEVKPHLLPGYFHQALSSQLTGIASWLFKLPLCPGSFPYLFVSFPQISSRLPNIINALSHSWAHHGYQGRNGVSWPHPAMNEAQSGPSETADGLFHSQFPKDLLYLLYRFPGSHVLRKIPLFEPSVLAS